MTEWSLYSPMLCYLETARLIRQDTLVHTEFPLHGRSVDLVTLTRSGSLTAYEFKLRDVGKALQQAAYNLRTFDRSFVVLGRPPTEERLALASALGIGVYLIAESRARLLMRPGPARYVEAARIRAERKLRDRGLPWSEHVRL